MESPGLSLAEHSLTNADEGFQINIIPRERIKNASKNTNNLTQDLTINESFSVARERKKFYLENITSFLSKEQLSAMVKVNYLF